MKKVKTTVSFTKVIDRFHTEVKLKHGDFHVVISVTDPIDLEKFATIFAEARYKIERHITTQNAKKAKGK